MSRTTKATPELVVLLGDEVVGYLVSGPGGKLGFTYDDGWRTDPNAYPLSVSMPLAARDHAGDVVAAYLWGLLPENVAPERREELTRDGAGAIDWLDEHLALVAWRALLILHLYEDARELARIGYREERRRYLAVIGTHADSGVRLRDDVDGAEEVGAEKDAA